MREITAASDKAPLLPLLKEHDLTKVGLSLGAGVDPDGLACQMAMQAIIKTINPEAEVCEFYRGDWDRPQNRTMRELLGLNPRPYSEAEGQEFTCIISLDGPPGVCFITGPHFVIDHHKQDIGHPNADVRPVGACSSILWEYCMAAGVDFTSEDGAKLATALAIGISTDTREMEVEATSNLDFEAAAFCGTHRDAKLFMGIKNYPKPRYYKDLECQAWDKATIEGTVLVTGLGNIPKERKGVVSSLAEEFVGYGSVSTAVVIAMIDGDISFSVRSFNSSINVNEFVGTVFKHGGGKSGAGAGTIPMPGLLKEGLTDELQRSVFDALYKAIAHRTLKYLGDGARSNGE